MAALSTTINETIRVFGVEPTNVWGTVQWGENWGYGDVDVIHFIKQSLDDATIADTITVSDSFISNFKKVFSETITHTDANEDLNLKDSNGYSYVFTLPTDDGEDRADTSWSESSDPTTSWSESSDPSTDWSAA